MKNYQKILMATFIFLFGTSFLLSSCQDKEQAEPDYTKAAVAAKLQSDTLDCSCLVNPADEITPEETEMLLYMREEEKLARDVYTTLYDQYGVPVFNNISKSEQVHMDRVLCLLNYYNIEDPATEEIGVFTNGDLQELYNSLVELGSSSYVNALTVGATIEDVDIYDLAESLEQTSNEAIITIFEHLKCASGNHLRAFTRLLTKNGSEYTPQYISQEEYDEIISGPAGPCGFGPSSGQNNKGGEPRGNGNPDCPRNK